MRKTDQIRNLGIAGLFILTSILAACGGKGGSTTTCSAATFQIANLSPRDVVVDPSKPVTLSWTYADPNCQATYYEVTLGASRTGTIPGMTQTSQTTAINWPELLEPGNSYFWSVYPILVSNGQAERGPGQVAYFFTGPACGAGEALSAPLLITPPNDTPFDPTAGITLHWDDPTTCLPEGAYSLQIAKTADFSSVLFASQTGHITELSLAAGWNNDVVQDCTRYYWRVRADEGTGNAGPWSSTGTFIINKVGAACNVIEPSPTQTPLPTATATLIPQTPLAPPAWLQANENVNCRRGPSNEYPIIDVLWKQWSARIYGRNEDSTWWYINTPNIAVGYYCWVWGEAVTVSGGSSQVPVIQPPPVPTWTPKPVTETPVEG